MITIYDIAKKLSLSPSTVSKALNDYHDVSAKTKARVNKAAKELGYTVNFNARILYTKRSYLIGLVYSISGTQGLQHPHFNEIIEAIRRELQKSGYELVLMGNQIHKDKVTLLEHARYRSLDGVFIMGGERGQSLSKQIKALAESEIPVASVSSAIESMSLIKTNDVAGATLATEHLLKLGHKKIIFLGSKHDEEINTLREKGFRYTMKQKGEPLGKKDILLDEVVTPLGLSYEGGRRLGKAFLLRADFKEYTAGFCVSDEMALGFHQELKENNVLIPDDFSLISFNDINSIIPNYLTTIRQNRKKIGMEATRYLLTCIEQGKENTPLATILLDGELIIRGTTKELIK